jgi:hypothetical protein
MLFNNLIFWSFLIIMNVTRAMLRTARCNWHETGEVSTFLHLSEEEIKEKSVILYANDVMHTQLTITTIKATFLLDFLTERKRKT